MAVPLPLYPQSQERHTQHLSCTVLSRRDLNVADWDTRVCFPVRAECLAPEFTLRLGDVRLPAVIVVLKTTSVLTSVPELTAEDWCPNCTRVHPMDSSGTRRSSQATKIQGGMSSASCSGEEAG